MQASVVTEDGSIASWMDDVVSEHTKPLDLPCAVSDVVRNEKVKSLHVCSFYSAMLTQQGRSADVKSAVMQMHHVVVAT